MSRNLPWLLPAVFSFFPYSMLRLARIDLLSSFVICGVLLFAAAMWVLERRRAAKQLALRCALGKQIGEFWEDLTVSPPERIETAIRKGLEGIAKVADADRICWYELNEQSGELRCLFSATGIAQPVFSAASISPEQLPFIAKTLIRHEPIVLRRMADLPSAATRDGEFLKDLEVASLLLIPSSSQGKIRGVLGLASQTRNHHWSGDVVYQLECIANVICAIMDRRLAQELMEETEERFRCLYEQASIGIAIKADDGRILHANPALCAMIGYDEAELLLLNKGSISHPADQENEKVLVEELRERCRASYRVEKRFFRKDGSLMWGEVTTSLLHRARGAPLIIDMVTDVSARRMAEESLRQRDRDLRKLAGHLISAQEEERGRISRELHDDIGHRLSMLAMEVDMGLRGRKRLEPRDEAALLRKVRQGLEHITTDVHGLSHALHSSSLKYCGLAVALRDLCAKYSHNYSLDVEIETQGLESGVPQHIALCLFRVAQEAMANALKHSGSKKIVLSVLRRSDQICLVIKDFGVGFDPQAQTPGIGLLTMRERLRTCGGAMQVTSFPNCGTEIRAELVIEDELAARATAAVETLM
jgi:PAS domain S-box-containing protein